MRLLLDTCDFLWYISRDPALTASTLETIKNPDDEVFLSVVSLWEIITKHRLGKLPLPRPPENYIPQQRDLHRIRSLSLEEEAVKRLASLPSIHRDPFDRMLICQAKESGMTLISSDPIMNDYPVMLL